MIYNTGNRNIVHVLHDVDAAELSFTEDPENSTESVKRQKIYEIIHSNQLTLEVCQHLARTEFGLVSNDIRKIIWPCLAEINQTNKDTPLGIDILKLHPEYSQVVLDVNRSLKRFPPGIPYEQRIALQDQLTILIMRIIHKHPNLKYYQGYHDVAITFLLVVGEQTSFAIMDKLSRSHFAECMHETMDLTQRRLMFIYPIIKNENSKLYIFLKKSSVGTLFALPWVLTWFGHSLKSYKCVVRLYDYFLASPMYFAIYVTAAIVLYRANDILSEDCDMAAIHCLLSQLPDDLPFEMLLKEATILHERHPLHKIESEVDDMIQKELDEKRAEDEKYAAAKKKLLENNPYKKTVINCKIFSLVLNKSFFLTTTFIIFGICAYYYKHQYWPSSIS